MYDRENERALEPAASSSNRDRDDVSTANLAGLLSAADDDCLTDPMARRQRVRLALNIRGTRIA